MRTLSIRSGFGNRVYSFLLCSSMVSSIFCSFSSTYLRIHFGNYISRNMYLRTFVKDLHYHSLCKSWLLLIRNSSTFHALPTRISSLPQLSLSSKNSIKSSFRHVVWMLLAQILEMFTFQEGELPSFKMILSGEKTYLEARTRLAETCRVRFRTRPMRSFVDIFVVLKINV